MKCWWFEPSPVTNIGERILNFIPHNFQTQATVCYPFCYLCAVWSYRVINTIKTIHTHDHHDYTIILSSNHCGSSAMRRALKELCSYQLWEALGLSVSETAARGFSHTTIYTVYIDRVKKTTQLKHPVGSRLAGGNAALDESLNGRLWWLK